VTCRRTIDECFKIFNNHVFIRELSLYDFVEEQILPFEGLLSVGPGTKEKQSKKCYFVFVPGYSSRSGILGITSL
jgi:hypothetical protein